MTNKLFSTTPCKDELVSQPHANVECKRQKRLGGRGEGSLDSALGPKQINKGHSPAISVARDHTALAIPSPPKPLLGDTWFVCHGLEMFHSTHVRKLSTPVQPPTTCNYQQNVTVEVGLIRRQEGCRLLERKLPSHPRRRRRVRRESSIRPSVRPRRPRPSGPRTRPSLLRCFLPREFLFIIVVIVIEGEKQRDASSLPLLPLRSLGCLLCQRACKWDRRRADGPAEAEDVAANDDVPVSPVHGLGRMGTDKYLLSSTHFREILLLCMNHSGINPPLDICNFVLKP